MSKRKAADSDNGGGVRHGVPSDPHGLVARNNALSAAAFVEHYWSFDSVESEIVMETRCLVDLKCASDMEETELQACFDLIEETSRHDYEPSSFGWHPKRKMREMKEKDMRYITLTSFSGVIEGFLSFMLTHDSVPVVPVLYLYEIHLSAHHQGKGIGKKLMAIVHGMSENLGVDKVMLTCFKNNVKARAFYERLGYGVDVSSPEDRTTRNKVVKTDYVIMSRALHEWNIGQSLESAMRNAGSHTRLRVSKSAADKPSASRHSLPGRLPNGHVLGERAVGGPSSQQATGGQDTVWTQEAARRLCKEFTDRALAVSAREQECYKREAKVGMREHVVRMREQVVMESEQEVDERENNLDEKEDGLFQREEALRETLSMQDRARLNLRARARVLKQREVRHHNRELRDREQRTREAHYQAIPPGFSINQLHATVPSAEALGDAYDDEEDDNFEEEVEEEVEEEDEEEDEDQEEEGGEEHEEEDCGNAEIKRKIKREPEVDGDILNLAEVDRKATKASVLGKAAFELPKPESMRGQKVVKDKVETWLRRTGSTAESFTKQARI